jgi:hypothetical protein
MRTLILGIATFLLSFNSQAQNQNVKSESTTTVTTIKDSDGVQKSVKTEKIQEVQNIELKDANSNVLNKDMQDTPVQVTATTEITTNGITRVVDVDRSAYYNLNGKKYRVTTDQSGYTMLLENSKRGAILRKTSNNNYIYRDRDRISFGYFDALGNLVLETYDAKTNKITVETYTVIKK